MCVSPSWVPRNLVSAMMASTLLVPPVSAGWGPEGATIRATASEIMQVAAVNDGGLGTLVVWQEGSISGGYLRALHVLPTGDLDPSWPGGGALVCDAQVNCTSLTLLPDGSGGAYVWWKEGSSFFLTRMTSTGEIASGWPPRGRGFGGIYPRNSLPCLIGDGTGGVYIAWSTLTASLPDYSTIRLIHIGPANTPAGGFPATYRTVTGGDPVTTWDLWPSLALAPDGGVFIAWASWSEDPTTVPGAMKLRRWTPAGLNPDGWTSEGVTLAPFPGEALNWNPYSNSPGPGAAMLALSPDDEAGGVFALVGLLTPDPNAPPVTSRLLRLDGVGGPSVGWPVGGREIPQGPAWYWPGPTEGSFRAVPDRRGGVLLGVPFFYDHGTDLNFVSSNPAHGWIPGYAVGGSVDHNDFVVNGSGGVYFAECTPVGPYGPYQLLAHLRLEQSFPSPGWGGFYEVHDDGPYRWYGDIALAESGDGGAVFFWSQMRERYGLFARRFNGSGQVTGVSAPAATTEFALVRLRFIAEEGVRVNLVIPEGEEARLDLYDVTGRRSAATRITGGVPGVREVTVPGTRTLAAGLYFAKLVTASGSRGGKVIVAR